jgi:hypothetical protein
MTLTHDRYCISDGIVDCDHWNTRHMTTTQNEALFDMYGTATHRDRTVVVAVDGTADGSSVRRLRAVDLSMATAAYRHSRAQGGHGGPVLLEVEVVLASTAREARVTYRDLALAPRDARSNYLYVGTPAGLSGLVADIGAAGVADGVILIPLDDRMTSHLLVSDAIPAMVRIGTVDARTAESLSQALAPFGRDT